MTMQKRKKPRWAVFQEKVFDIELPLSGAVVKVKEPDILSIVIDGEFTLDDTFFSMFAIETKKGMSEDEQNLTMMKKVNQSDGAIVDFINIICKAAFVEPELVDSKNEADFETTVPVGSIKLGDRMAVFGRFSDMFNQLGDLQRFRPEANGDVHPPPKSEGLSSDAE